MTTNFLPFCWIISISWNLGKGSPKFQFLQLILTILSLSTYTLKDAIRMMKQINQHKHIIASIHVYEYVAIFYLWQRNKICLTDDNYVRKQRYLEWMLVLCKRFMLLYVIWKMILKFYTLWFPFLSFTCGLIMKIVEKFQKKETCQIFSVK